MITEKNTKWMGKIMKTSEDDAFEFFNDIFSQKVRFQLTLKTGPAQLIMYYPHFKVFIEQICSIDGFAYARELFKIDYFEYEEFKMFLLDIIND